MAQIQMELNGMGGGTFQNNNATPWTIVAPFFLSF